jgi:hypothetical protein
MKKVLVIACVISTAIFSWGLISFFRDGLNASNVLCLVLGFNGAVITGLTAYLIYEFGTSEKATTN